MTYPDRPGHGDYADYDEPALAAEVEADYGDDDLGDLWAEAGYGVAPTRADRVDLHADTMTVRSDESEVDLYEDPDTEAHPGTIDLSDPIEDLDEFDDIEVGLRDRDADTDDTDRVREPRLRGDLRYNDPRESGEDRYIGGRWWRVQRD